MRLSQRSQTYKQHRSVLHCRYEVTTTKVRPVLYDPVGLRVVGEHKRTKSRNAPEWRGMRPADKPAKPRNSHSGRRRIAAPVRTTQTDPARIAAAAEREARIAAMEAAAEAQAAAIARLTELNRI